MARPHGLSMPWNVETITIMHAAMQVSYVQGALRATIPAVPHGYRHLHVVKTPWMLAIICWRHRCGLALMREAPQQCDGYLYPRLTVRGHPWCDEVAMPLAISRFFTWFVHTLAGRHDVMSRPAP